MKRRQQRRHWSGSSNRHRCKKILDTETALNADPRERVMAENRLATSMSKTGLTRSVVVFDPPQLVKTKLGGIYYVESKKCVAQPYVEMIEDSYAELQAKGLVQRPWSNDQPPLGIPIWSNDPARTEPFSTCGKSAPHAANIETSAPVIVPVCGIPTRGLTQFCN